MAPKSKKVLAPHPSSSLSPSPVRDKAKSKTAGMGNAKGEAKGKGKAKQQGDALDEACLNKSVHHDYRPIAIGTL